MKFSKIYTVKELLDAVNYTGNIVGEFNSQVVGFCDDFFARDNFLTWTDNDCVLNHLLELDAHLSVITNVRLPHYSAGKTVIHNSNPLRLFEAIANRFSTNHNKEPQIGNNTFLHDTAVIGKNVIIGDNCIIEPYVIIGDNTIIGSNVHIGSFTTLGNNPYYTLWDKNGRLRTRTIYGNVVIGNDVQIGSYCSIDNGITISTEIANGCKMGNYVEIGHDVIIHDDCCICAQCAIGGFVEIEHGCVLWGRVGIANHINIASNTTLLAASIVTKSISDSGNTFCGYPAIERFKHWKRLAKR